MRKPDFDNLLAVLNREVPDRPTLFEFFLNDPLYEKLAGLTPPPDGKPLEGYARLVQAFANAGYDYVTTHASDYGFPTSGRTRIRLITRGWIKSPRCCRRECG